MHVGAAVETVADVAVTQNSGHTFGVVQLAIARRKVILVVKVMIHLDVKLPAVGSVEDDLVKIFSPGGRVVDRRQRVEIDDFLADGIDEILVDHIGDSEVWARAAGMSSPA